MLVQPKHQVYISKRVRPLAEEWCIEHLGKCWTPLSTGRNGQWACYWAGNREPHAGSYRFMFTHERDAVLFALMWT
jgi:hypothetical protein